jgi:L-fuconolactonase
MTVDAHVHFWRIARGDNVGLDPVSPLWRDYEPPELLPELQAAGVDRVVLVQAAETHAENLYMIGLARRFLWIAGVVAWLDPSSPAVAEEVAALLSVTAVRGFRPVRNGNASLAWMLEAPCDAGYRAIADGGASLDVLVENPDDLPVVIALARRHSGLAIVLDHCGKPDIAGGRMQPWADHVAELAALPNVACKFSGLLNRARPLATPDDVAPYALHVLSAFGAGRVMWASDWPPLTRAAGYARWRSVSTALLADLSGAERASVEHGTAERVYRLPSAA